jgi:hypothetical protein
MFGNPTRRVAAILLTALLLFSTIVVIPQNTVSAASETNVIGIHVTDNIALPITGASVVIKEVHTGNLLSTAYQGSTYTASDAESGWYVLKVSASGYFPDEDNIGFRFDGQSPKYIDVVLTPYGLTPYTYTVYVNDTGGPISGASVSFYHRSFNQTVASKTTNASGFAAIKIFGGYALDLVVSKPGYEMNVQAIPSISSSANVNVTMNAAIVVQGSVLNSTGDLASGVVAYMYNTNTAIPWEKRVLKYSNSGDAHIRFDAYAGSWVLVISGSNIDSYVNAGITLPGSYTWPARLNEKNKSTEDIALTFSDWNTLAIHTDAVWTSDRTYLGLDYSDIGSLRAQVDLAFGNANGVVASSEWTSLQNRLTTQGPNYVTTYRLLKVNNTEYISSPASASVTLSSYTGTVASNATLTYASDFIYASQNTLSTTSPHYSGSMPAIPFDSLSVARVFTIDIVNVGAPGTEYEMTNNDTFSTKINVSGYTVIEVDPLYSATGGTTSVKLDFSKSEDPVSRSMIVIGDNTYARRNATGVLLGYIVRNSTNVTFSASGSSDTNNSNPLTYNWDFGDGNTASTKYVLTWHNYTTPHNWTAKLTVVDVTGNSDTSDINVSVDGTRPSPAILVKNSTGATLSDPITVDQGAVLKLMPNGTFDDMIAGDGFGSIKYYDWKVGSDAMVRRLYTDADHNLSYTFSKAGAIKVVLNVTDVVGNYTNTTRTINVRDKTGPVIAISNIWNATWGTSLLERAYVHFNASGTTDNIDNVTLLNFTWKFGDGSTVKSGIGLKNVTHNYSSYGQYELTLNVTDLSGNNASLVQQVYIGAGPRSNIAPTKVSFDSKMFEEGVSGKITVNITNDGSATANNISIELWSYSGSVAQKRIGNITTFYDKNGTITSLKVGESGFGYFLWTPDARGNYTIRAIANSTDQKQSNWISSSIDVNEAGWKKTALYVGILVVVIVIPLLLIARRRIGSTGAMLRRPKKEKSPKEKREEEGKK